MVKDAKELATSLISLRMNPKIIETVKRVAKVKGMKYQTLVKSWISEKAAMEEKMFEKDRPYFLWDESTTESELKNVLKNGTPHDKYHYISKIMREASYPDIWKYISIGEIVKNWDEIKSRLGRKKEFWNYLISVWRKNGYIKEKDTD